MVYKSKPISRRQKFQQFARGAGHLFSVKQAASVLKKDNQTTAKVLARWQHQGHIARVSHGLYSLVPVDMPATEFMLEDSWQLVPRLFTHSYIGGWTAAEHWDITEQIFNTLIIFTTDAVPHKKMMVGQQAFQLKHIQASRLFGLQTVWRDQEKILISDMHRTIIDFFDEPETAGGLQHAVDCLKNYLKKSESDLETLNAYAEKINNGALYKRLGFLLEQLMGNDLLIVKNFHAKITKGYSYLDPKQKEQVRLISRWHLFVPRTFDIETE